MEGIDHNEVWQTIKGIGPEGIKYGFGIHYGHECAKDEVLSKIAEVFLSRGGSCRLKMLTSYLYGVVITKDMHNVIPMNFKEQNQL